MVQVSSAVRLACRCCLPVALPHVEQSIDGFMTSSLDPEMLNTACKEGASEETLEFILSRTTPDWRTAIRFAAEGGHLHVFEWMATEREDKRGPWNGDFRNSLQIAAGSGHLALVRWLYERGSDTSIWTHPLEYTREYAENVWKYYYHIPSAMGNAAANGHLAVVQWLYGVTNWVHADAIKRAISRGHVDLVKWIYEVKGDRPCIIVLSKCVGEAAENGHLRMLKWLGLEGILDRVTISIDGAAQNGFLEVIQWCLETDLAECTTYTLDLAVTHGHLEVAKWLHDKVPDNSAWAFRGSAADEAESGHLDGLQRRLCAQYLGTQRGMDEAAKDGHVDVMAWLHKRQHAGGTHCTVVSAVHKGRLNVVQWLHEHYSDKFSSFVMDEAATQGQLEIVQWLHENRTEGCTTAAMDQAALHGHFDVVLWLISHRTEGFSSQVTGGHDTLRRLS